MIIMSPLMLLCAFQSRNRDAFDFKEQGGKDNGGA